MAEKILAGENKVLRHGISGRLVHWIVALSSFVLIFSGFGQMPIYRRYGVANLPGLGWSGDYSVTLVIHYLAAMVLVFGAVYHLVFHLTRREFDLLPRRGDLRDSYLIIKAMVTKGTPPPSDKYLAEQRLAYAFIAFNLLALIITGILKVLKNLPGIWYTETTLVWVTGLHNLATFLLVFGIIGHLAAFLFKENRPLLPGIFTGKVSLDYVRERHSLWLDRLISR